MKHLAPLLAAIGITSCSVLDPVEDRSMNHILEAAAPDRTITGHSPILAVARPSLPGYLDRQQLVTRVADGGNVVMNANQLWAGSLDENIARVTAQNLARLLNSLNIQPVQAFITLDYSHLLELRFSRFDADAASRTVILECTWRLQPVTGRLATTHPFRTVVPIANPEFSATSAQDARVAAMNQALAELAADIARRR